MSQWSVLSTHSVEAQGSSSIMLYKANAVNCVMVSIRKDGRTDISPQRNSDYCFVICTEH